MANFAETDGGASRRMHTVVKVGGIVMLVGAVGLFGYRAWRSISSYQQHVANMNEITAQIDNYEVEARTVSATPTASADDVRGYVGMAERQGKLMADLQTGYQDISMSEVEAYARDKVGSLLTEDAQRYSVMWCPKLKSRYTWEFMSTYQYDKGEVPCLFKCTVEDGTLVAYAKTVFDTDSGLFSEVDYTYTNEISPYRFVDSYKSEQTPVGDSTSSSEAETTEVSDAAVPEQEGGEE